MRVQKRTLMRILLIPLLFVVLFQGLLPFSMLLSSVHDGKQCSESGQLYGGEQ